MKLKIDTDAKVIQVEQQCKLVELFDFVKKIFPDNKWKDYSIEAVPVIVNWGNPIYIPSVWQFDYSQVPYTLTTSGTNETYCIQTN